MQNCATNARQLGIHAPTDVLVKTRISLARRRHLADAKLKFAAFADGQFETKKAPPAGAPAVPDRDDPIALQKAIGSTLASVSLYGGLRLLRVEIFTGGLQILTRTGSARCAR